MKRRTFLAAAATLPWLAGCRPPDALMALGVPVSVLRPGMDAGHALRDRHDWPAATRTRRVEVAILGSGIAGLAAAWRFGKEGFRDFVLLSGPEPDGNAAAARFDTADGPFLAPRGAHYLPLPGIETPHVREILADLGLLEGPLDVLRPRYDEAAIAHAPTERVFHDGSWHEGLLPEDLLTPAVRQQLERFDALMQHWRGARGRDGRKAFAMPLAHSSRDAELLALDRLSFAQWLRQQGINAAPLHAWLDYACRDDYGAGLDHISAWAGIHYFASRDGHAANADEGAVLTWPEGLQRLAHGLRHRLQPDQQMGGTALRVTEKGGRVEVLCIGADGHSFALDARRVICAMPLHVAAHVVPHIRDYGFDPERHRPPQAPWMVGNFLFEGFPLEQKHQMPAWDNVVHGSPALGWVVSTHQLLRAARPSHTVFTTYRALNHDTPEAIRRWLVDAPDQALLALAAQDLLTTYDSLQLRRPLRAVELTVRAHAMASPTPGFLSNPGLLALREADGPLLFAHSDLSGMSLFEEASGWGEVAARKILG